MSTGNAWERELAYYRRECNDLGARLLRLQEEQSQAFREARRSRTVVKLLRELYRLGDLVRPLHDVGGLMLETVVDNALCDCAALLREEPIGSGGFLVVHAIGVPDAAVESVVAVSDPPDFAYTSSRSVAANDTIIAILGVPYVLWAYDRASGYALVIGNRSETNVHRPFEMGDQELIESALSVFLDVHYRKHAEMQLRQAKQSAEALITKHQQAIGTIAEKLQPHLRSLLALPRILDAVGQMGPTVSSRTEIRRTLEIISAAVQSVYDDAVKAVESDATEDLLDIEWTSVNDLVQSLMRSIYPLSIRLGVDLGFREPKRRVAICIDRRRIQDALERLLRSSLHLTSSGGLVRLTASRRSDGVVELVITVGERSGPGERVGTTTNSADIDLLKIRRLLQAHGGSLRLDMQRADFTRATLVFPACITRDDELVERASE
jgi:signal transduction histidine kinase